MLSPALMISSAAPAAARPGADALGPPGASESTAAFSSALADADGARQLASASASAAASDTARSGGDGNEMTPHDAEAAADSVAQAQQSLVDVAAMLASLQGSAQAQPATLAHTAPLRDAASRAVETVDGGAALIDAKADAKADTKADVSAPTLARGDAADAAGAGTPEPLPTVAADGSGGIDGNRGATPPTASATASASAAVTTGAGPAVGLATAGGKARGQPGTGAALALAASAASPTSTTAAPTSPVDADPYKASEGPTNESRAGIVNADRRGRAAASARERDAATSATSSSAAERAATSAHQGASADGEAQPRSEAVPATSNAYTQPMPGAPTASALRAHASLNAPGADVPFQAQLSAALNSPEFAPALGVQLSTLTRNGIAEARLHLNPAELGPIAVQIELDGRSAQVVLSASHADTRQALEQAMPQLASALRDAGFTMTGGGVFQQPQERPAPGDGPRTGTSGRDMESAESDADAIDGIRGTRVRVPQGVVDLYA